MTNFLLTLDIGNSHPHLGIFKDEELAKVLPLSELKGREEVPQNLPLISSRVGNPDYLNQLSFLKPNQFTAEIKVKDKSFLDMPVHYSETLGEDRLATSYYCYKKYSEGSSQEGPLLLIDSGTFITMDFIGKEGLLGGFIFPGIHLFTQSYDQGKNLFPPLLSQVGANNYSKDLAHSTEEAMEFGTFHYIRGILKSAFSLIKPNKTILTGGSHWPFSRSLEELEVPTELNPHLIHHALKLIFRNGQSIH